MKKTFSQRVGHKNYEWFWAMCVFLNPLRGPGILVAIVATFAEELGQTDTSQLMFVLITLANLVVIRLISLIMMDIGCVCLDILFDVREKTKGTRKKAKNEVV